MSNFEQVFEVILGFEGGYVNDPSDPGGETKFGISKRTFPWVDIAHLTKDQAAELYRKYYWAPLKCDMLPFSIALLTFNAAVLSGNRYAVLVLQRAVGTKQDGVIGPKTISAATMIDREDAILSMLSSMAVHFGIITKNRPASTKFLRGWMMRLFKLQREIYRRFDGD